SLEQLAELVAALGGAERALEAARAARARAREAEASELQASRRRSRGQAQAMLEAAELLRQEAQQAEEARGLRSPRERQARCHASLRHVQQLTRDMKDLAVSAELRPKHSALLQALRGLEERLAPEVANRRPSRESLSPRALPREARQRFGEAAAAFEDELAADLASLHARHDREAHQEQAEILASLRRSTEERHGDVLQAARAAIAAAARGPAAAALAEEALAQVAGVQAALAAEAFRHGEVEGTGPRSLATLGPRRALLEGAAAATTAALGALQVELERKPSAAAGAAQPPWDGEWEAAVAGAEARWAAFCRDWPAGAGEVVFRASVAVPEAAELGAPPPRSAPTEMQLLKELDVELLVGPPAPARAHPGGGGGREGGEGPPGQPSRGGGPEAPRRPSASPPPAVPLFPTALPGDADTYSMDSTRKPSSRAGSARKSSRSPPPAALHRRPGGVGSDGSRRSSSSPGATARPSSRSPPPAAALPGGSDSLGSSRSKASERGAAPEAAARKASPSPPAAALPGGPNDGAGPDGIGGAQTQVASKRGAAPEEAPRKASPSPPRSPLYPAGLARDGGLRKVSKRGTVPPEVPLVPFALPVPGSDGIDRLSSQKPKQPAAPRPAEAAAAEAPPHAPPDLPEVRRPPSAARGRPTSAGGLSGPAPGAAATGGPWAGATTAPEAALRFDGLPAASPVRPGSAAAGQLLPLAAFKTGAELPELRAAEPRALGKRCEDDPWHTVRWAVPCQDVAPAKEPLAREAGAEACEMEQRR
ncbi:unnamed protein product, partial [Prorocentrum cordatum]